jgi:hypothetical protein
LKKIKRRKPNPATPSAAVPTVNDPENSQPNHESQLSQSQEDRPFSAMDNTPGGDVDEEDDDGEAEGEGEGEDLMEMSPGMPSRTETPAMDAEHENALFQEYHQSPTDRADSDDDDNDEDVEDAEESFNRRLTYTQEADEGGEDDDSDEEGVGHEEIARNTVGFHANDSDFEQDDEEEEEEDDPDLMEED